MKKKAIIDLNWLDAEIERQENLFVKTPIENTNHLTTYHSWFSALKHVKSKCEPMKESKEGEVLDMLKEILRRVDIIKSEPDGIVRNTMIDNIDLGIEQLIKEVES